MEKTTPNEREIIKTSVILKEMYDNGVINFHEAMLYSMEEGIRFSKAVANNEEYHCTITY